jgi:hypothetical protein
MSNSQQAERRGEAQVSKWGERELRRRAMFTTVLSVAQRREWAENAFSHEWILEDIPILSYLNSMTYDTVMRLK